MKCGLLGKKLSHSYSPAIHKLLSDDYSYELYERMPEQLGSFMKGSEYDCLNVTIPYKKDVIPYCSYLSDTVKAIGSVNTIVHTANGELAGYNTDAYGFEGLLKKAEISVTGKKAIVLGSGGTSLTARYVLEKLGAEGIYVISRSGDDNYSNISRHYNADIVINTTPVGMYPNNGESPIDLAKFEKCEGVVDVIYNPSRTALLLQAERLGIPHTDGLYMLVAQAKKSAELFTGKEIPDRRISEIEYALSAKMKNIVILGDRAIAGQIALKLAESLSRPLHNIECESCADIGKESGNIIVADTIGDDNYPGIHQNSTIFSIDAKEIEYADYMVEYFGNAEDTANTISEMLGLNDNGERHEDTCN